MNLLCSFPILTTLRLQHLATGANNGRGDTQISGVRVTQAQIFGNVLNTDTLHSQSGEWQADLEG